MKNHVRKTHRNKADETLIRVFASLGKKLRAVKTPKEAARVILSIADELFGWDSCFLTSYSEQEDMAWEIVIMDTMGGKRKEVPPNFPVSTPGSMFRRVMSKGAQLILRKQGAPDKDGLVPFGKTSRKSASLMFVPIRKGEECVGMLSIQRYRQNAYDKKDHELLQILADYCGETLKRTIAEARLRDLRNDYDLLQQAMTTDQLEHPEAFSEIITQNPIMKSVFQYVEAIAGTTKTVLITGETGVGKELIARAIHKLNGRKGPFVSVNIAGLNDDLLSDTLFGHRRGAFTGADISRPGLIESANRGTLFLDEIGDLAILSQIKLLRLLQEKEYYPLGSDRPKYTDTRIIVSTNQDLQGLLRSGRFRKDLFFRIKMHHVHIPPLRKRKDDLPLLVDHFLKKAAESLGKKKPTPPGELIQFLRTYHFPGNIRELESMIFNAVSHHQSRMISMKLFKQYIDEPHQAGISRKKNLPRPEESKIEFPEKLPTIGDTTRLLIAEALKRSDGNQSIAAQLLGISPPALSRRLKKWVS